MPADTEYGGICAELEAAGQPIGPTDPFVAAHARSMGVTLVTHYVGEFRRVRGLKVEDWMNLNLIAPALIYWSRDGANSGSSLRSTSTAMLRGTPGWRAISPAFSSEITI